jgi:glycine/D-amino acid oxidase-like deaminating enzyme
MDVTPAPLERAYDVVIVGAGFYGCALAAHLGRQGLKVLVCEENNEPMSRASATNQARVHTGFHYPRSYVTALRSWHNFGRFLSDFDEAIIRDFQMLYAIARYGTKVDPNRFYGMFRAMGAPIEAASGHQRSLFSAELVEMVFACTEYAFDYTIIRRIVLEQLRALPVEMALGMRVTRIDPSASECLSVSFQGGSRVEANRVFNVTYSQLNSVLKASGATPLPLKHELVEIALVKPPPALHGLAVTLMDGAFFSCMPYPAANAYSLTHVRYTPHLGWTDASVSLSAYEIARRAPRNTRWRHMVNDARRYLPAMSDVVWQRSLFEVKTVPIKNEKDDGRPILLNNHDSLPGLYSVLGSKIDNIYDLFEAID